MTVFDDVISKLWRGQSPYLGFNEKRFRPDPQGWNSNHVFLADAIKNTRPKLILEVGVWKGASSIFMAKAIQEQKLDAVVISVDTFLGSWEHWVEPRYFASLVNQNGYPSMYFTFLTNVVEAEVQNVVVPLPLDSGNACHVIASIGLRPDIIHIDGGHDYDAVTTDLNRWWPLLRPGGILIADDYDPDGKAWPSVKKAVDDFVARTPHSDFGARSYKAQFTKPA